MLIPKHKQKINKKMVSAIIFWHVKTKFEISMHVGVKQEIIQSVLSAHLPFHFISFVSIFNSLYIHCIYISNPIMPFPPHLVHMIKVITFCIIRNYILLWSLQYFSASWQMMLDSYLSSVGSFMVKSFKTKLNKELKFSIV